MALYDFLKINYTPKSILEQEGEVGVWLQFKFETV